MGPVSIVVRTGALTLFAAVLVSGCAASARQRPVEGSPVATSGATLENARRVLEGKWTLVSLNVTGPDGRKADVEATGTLVSDAFGNLSVEYRMSPAGQKMLQSISINQPTPVSAPAAAWSSTWTRSRSPMSRRRPTPHRSMRNWRPAATTRSRSSGLVTTPGCGRTADVDHALRRWPGRGGEPLEKRFVIGRLSQTSGDV